jgi:hypothetical protein
MIHVLNFCQGKLSEKDFRLRSMLMVLTLGNRDIAMLSCGTLMKNMMDANWQRVSSSIRAVRLMFMVGAHGDLWDCFCNPAIKLLDHPQYRVRAKAAILLAQMEKPEDIQQQLKEAVICGLADPNLTVCLAFLNLVEKIRFDLRLYSCLLMLLNTKNNSFFLVRGLQVLRTWKLDSDVDEKLLHSVLRKLLRSARRLIIMETIFTVVHFQVYLLYEECENQCDKMLSSSDPNIYYAGLKCVKELCIASNGSILKYQDMVLGLFESKREGFLISRLTDDYKIVLKALEILEVVTVRDTSRLIVNALSSYQMEAMAEQEMVQQELERVRVRLMDKFFTVGDHLGWD